MRKVLLTIAAVAGLAAPAFAAETVPVPKQDWSFNGIFGTYDRASAQRGLQVYKELCAACHSLRFVHYRNIADLGYSPEEVRAFAEQFQVQDGPDDQGDMFMRPGRASDRFVSPYPNEQAARAANGGAYPPDLSLMVKARIGGADYLHALLVGYADPPPGAEVMPGMYYNRYFPGHQIAMPPPLVEGIVQFADGTEASTEQLARDVTTFLAWAAEPHMEARKQMGIKVILFLIVLAGLTIAVKRKVWAAVH